MSLLQLQIQWTARRGMKKNKEMQCITVASQCKCDRIHWLKEQRVYWRFGNKYGSFVCNKSSIKGTRYLGMLSKWRSTESASSKASHHSCSPCVQFLCAEIVGAGMFRQNKCAWPVNSVACTFYMFSEGIRGHVSFRQGIWKNPIDRHPGLGRCLATIWKCSMMSHERSGTSRKCCGGEKSSLIRWIWKLCNSAFQLECETRPL